jgi:hypothetical protein
MSMMLKLGALPAGTAIMVCRGDGMKKMPMRATGKMLFYISVNFCQRPKIKGRLVQSPQGFGGWSCTSQPIS